MVLAAIAAALFCGLAVAVETNGLAGFDEAARMELHSLASPLLTLLAEKLTWLGSLGVLALFGVVAVAVLVHAGRRDGAVLLTVTMVGAVLTHLFIVGGNPALPVVLLVTTAAIAERVIWRVRSSCRFVQ